MCKMKTALIPVLGWIVAFYIYFEIINNIRSRILDTESRERLNSGNQITILFRCVAGRQRAIFGG